MKFYSHLDYPGRGTIINLFTEKYEMESVKKPENADIIVWNGGEDIGTTIYGEWPVFRGIPRYRSERDDQEIEMFEKFKGDKSKLLLGICRGAQLLNCLNGGKLYQDVDGHNSSHSMMDLKSGKIIHVTSTHHQQMRPAPQGAVIIGVASESTYKDRQAGVEDFKPTKDLRQGADVEIVWYPATRSLCIQGHPEYVPNSQFADYTLSLIQRFAKESCRFAA